MQMPALAHRRSDIASGTKTTALTDHRFGGRITSFTRQVPKLMNKQQGNTPVHIWRVDFEGMEMRTTSSDGIHVWIARDDVMEALQIPDPGYALSFVTPEDQAALSSGTDVPDEEGEPDGLPMINEIAVYEIMARFPTPPTGRFKPWLLRLRHLFFELMTRDDEATFLLQ